MWCPGNVGISIPKQESVCVYVCACVHACVCARVCVYVGGKEGEEKIEIGAAVRDEGSDI